MISVDRVTGVIVVSHREIRGVMPVMSMPLHVERASEMQAIEPGARIRFDLVTGRGKSQARNIRLVQAPAEDFTPPAAPNRLSIGSEVPDFELTTHTGGTLRLSQLRGRPVAIQFIYTRCPLPDVCPRLASHFAYADKRLAGKAVFLSVTLDPTFDTPQELARYAKRWHASPSWSFLTGPEPAIEALAGRFGVVFWPEEGAIAHTSSTAILDSQGRLQAVIDGSSHTAPQLLHLIENQLR